MNYGFKKGKKAEDIVRKACEELLSENKIAGFERHDEPGVDSILFFDENPLKIEVKSSYNAEFLHNIKHSTKVLVVPIKREKLSEKKAKEIDWNDQKQNNRNEIVKLISH